MKTPKSECLYCQKNETLDSLMIKICDLGVSQLFLFREQTYHGRCNVVYKDHDVDFHELDEEQRSAFMRDVASAGAAVKKAFGPARVNYGSYADKISHLHVHIVPKYMDGPDFGSIFEMNPRKVYLSDEEYEAVIGRIKAEILT
jgi:diadenosine tetraphosphate (Ap4A) HIT family hydrolase